MEKKEAALPAGTRPLLPAVPLAAVAVRLQGVEEAEGEEMGASVGKQREPRWLWPAITPRSGHVRADVLGRRPDAVLLKLKALGEAVGITRY